MSGITVAMVAAVEEASKHESWWHAAVEMVRSPADYAAHFVIEGVFTLLGVHRIHALMHGGAKRVTSRVKVPRVRIRVPRRGG